MEYTLLTVMAHHIGLYAFIQEVSINIKDLSLLLLTQIQDTTLQNNSYFFKKKKKFSQQQLTILFLQFQSHT